MDKLTKILFAINFLIIGIASYLFYELSNANNVVHIANYVELTKKISDNNIARSGGDYDLRFEIRQSKTNLEQQITKLEREVESLEKELKELDEKAYKVELNSSKPNVKWMKLSNWRKLQKGFKEDQVILLLGEPTRRSANDSRSISLFYTGYGKNASVVLDQYLGVKTWSEPY